MAQSFPLPSSPLPSPRLFDAVEAAAPSDPLFIQPDGIVSYGEMAGRARRLAGGLAQAGLQRGDRLGLLAPNCPEWLLVALACSRLGVAVVSLNVRLGAPEVADIVARAGCKALVWSAAYRDGASTALLRSIPADKTASVALWVTLKDPTPDAGTRSLARLEADGSAEAPGEGQGSDPCLIIATSGTTSRPKLVVHIEERVARHARDVAATFGFTPTSTLLLTIPLCGAFGYTTAMAALAGGRPIVLMADFDARRAVDLIAEHAVTHVLGSNDMLHHMLKATDAPRALPTVTMFGHANFTPGLTDLPAEAERRGVPMRGFFGMSEILAFFAAQPADGPVERRAEGGGRPVCATGEARIRDPDDGTPTPIGEPGQIEVKTPNMMVGYLDDPDTTAAAYTSDGFFRTGDFGVGLADGGFNFVSRINDVLRVGGYLVSPVEIEDVVKAAQDMVACQVVAVSRPQGVRPVAFVVAHPGQACDEAVIMRACTDGLAAYKRPIRVFQIDELPVTDGPNGLKVKKNVLRDMATALLDAAG